MTEDGGLMTDAYIDALVELRESCDIDGCASDAHGDDRTKEIATAVTDASDCLTRAIHKMLVPCRETSLALTRLEEAVMWAMKSIESNGVA